MLSSVNASYLSRIEAARAEYSPMCAEYFDYIEAKLEKRGAAFPESACGFLLLDNLLKKNGVDRKALAISRDPAGRPRVINRNDVDFSVSHSEGAAFCCVALGMDASVGADIQFARAYSKERMQELAKIFMGQGELAAFLKNGCLPGDFFRAWTRRESGCKRCGSDAPPMRSEYMGGRIHCCGREYYYSVCLPCGED